MRHFIANSGILNKMPLSSKIVYTCFNIFILIAMINSIFLYYDSMNFSLASTAEWYNGNEANMMYAKSFRQLLETNHFHLYTFPVILLIITHLFALTSLKERTKISLIILCFVSAMIHIFIPFLIRYVSPSFHWMMPFSALGFGIPLLFMLIWPMLEMWCVRTQRKDETYT